MVHGIDTFLAKRPTTASPASVPRPITDQDDSLPLLVLVPVGSLLMAGLLVFALSRMVGVPGLEPSHSPSGVEVDVQADLASFSDIELR